MSIEKLFHQKFQDSRKGLKYNLNTTKILSTLELT